MSVTDVSGNGSLLGPVHLQVVMAPARAYISPSPAPSYVFTPSAAVYSMTTEKSNSEPTFTVYTHSTTTALFVFCFLI